MVFVKPIRTDEDLERALARVDDIFHAEPGTPESDELDILASLIEIYENKRYPIAPPSPIDAIEFEMEQRGLTRRDLIPYIGSGAKVSEVLSGKRGITMAMARALHKHLKIPAEILLQEPDADFAPTFDEMDPRKFPLKAMANLGWIPDASDLRDRAEEYLSALLERAGGRGMAAASALYRKNDNRRVNAKSDPYALAAWRWQTLAAANENLPSADCDADAITPDFLRDVARLSASERGPLLAKDALAENGIALTVTPHLPKTHLDGAALTLADGRPVIGLTLRYDRIDNFWFCLMHELAHVGLHIGDEFMDDLDLRGGDRKETDADELASEALIPASAWENSAARERPNAMSVRNLASELGIHPAIVAGRVRYERRNYRLLSHFVGNGQVRRLFASKPIAR